MIKLKWHGFFRKIFNKHRKHPDVPPIMLNSAQERSISILQKRYGYTREQATYQLDKHYSGAWLG